MKQIKTKSKDIICVEVPEDSFMSLLQSKGIDTSKEDKLLIIKIL